MIDKDDITSVNVKIWGNPLDKKDYHKRSLCVIVRTLKSMVIVYIATTYP